MGHTLTTPFDAESVRSDLSTSVPVMRGTITYIISPPLPKGLITYLSVPHRQLSGHVLTIGIEHCPDVFDGCAHAEKRKLLGS